MTFIQERRGSATGWLRALAALSAVALLAACGGDSPSNSAPTAGADAGPEAESTSELSGDPVVIATTISGVYGEVDQDWTVGIQAGIERVNQNGGVHGRPLEAERCVTEFDPNVAAQCARDFVANESIVAAVSTQGGVAEFYEVLEPAELAIFEPAINPAEFKPTNIFGVNANLGQNFAAANVCFSELERDSLGFMYADTAAGAGLIPAFNDGVLPAFNHQLAVAVPVPLGAADVTTYAANLVSANPDCVGLALPDVVMLAVIRALNQQGYEGQIIIPGSAISTPLLVEELGDLAEGIISLSSYDITAPAYDEFVADMHAVAGDDASNRISDNALTNWIGARFFAQVANSIDTLDRPSILAAVREITDFDGFGLVAGPVDFTAVNTSSMGGALPNLRNTKLMAYRIEGGERVPVSGEWIDAFVPSR